jgi:sugar phosphate isomerase/epimerase
VSDLKISISSPTTYNATIDEDIDNYADAGATGIGLWEYKFGEGRDEQILEHMLARGLEATLCCGTTPSIIPDPVFNSPVTPKDRTEALVASIKRFAKFKPAGILCVSGPQNEYETPQAALKVVAEGLRIAADAAGENGMYLGLEPYRVTNGTLITTMDETLALVDAIGSPNVKLIMDAWHFWDLPGILDDLKANVDKLVGIQLSDYREPTRSWCDRVLPGDGVIDTRGLFRAMEDAGYDGWYDIEVFSDDGRFGDAYPDSLWSQPAADVARRGVEQVRRLWETRRD